MCLAIPGRILSVSEGASSLERTAKVAFGGITKEVNLAYVPDAQVDEYVIVHVGFALSKVDPEEAERVFAYLRELGELEELEPEGGVA
jgi:hydrogenase expression/formation protein HypC